MGCSSSSPVMCCGSNAPQQPLPAALHVLKRAWAHAHAVKMDRDASGMHSTVADLCGVCARKAPPGASVLCTPSACSGRMVCPAVVLKVTDGDTLSVLLPVLPPGGTTRSLQAVPFAVRVAGIDAPEMNKAYIVSSVNAAMNSKNSDSHRAGVVARAAAVEYMGTAGLLPHPCYEDAEWAAGAGIPPPPPGASAPPRDCAPIVWLSWAPVTPAHATAEEQRGANAVGPRLVRVDMYNRVLADVWTSTPPDAPQRLRDTSLAHFMLDRRVAHKYGGRGVRGFTTREEAMIVALGEVAARRAHR